jgi:cytochrome b561
MLIFYSLQSVVIAVVIGCTIGKPDIFGLVALGIIVLRLITALFYLVVMYLLGTTEASLFAIQFMALYLCFLAFELITVLANLRQN